MLAVNSPSKPATNALRDALAPDEHVSSDEREGTHRTIGISAWKSTQRTKEMQREDAVGLLYLRILAIMAERLFRALTRYLNTPESAANG